MNLTWTCVNNSLWEHMCPWISRTVNAGFYESCMFNSNCFPKWLHCFPLQPQGLKVSAALYLHEHVLLSVFILSQFSGAQWYLLTHPSFLSSFPVPLLQLLKILNIINSFTHLCVRCLFTSSIHYLIFFTEFIILQRIFHFSTFSTKLINMPVWATSVF